AVDPAGGGLTPQSGNGSTSNEAGPEGCLRARFTVSSMSLVLGRGLVLVLGRGLVLILGWRLVLFLGRGLVLVLDGGILVLGRVLGVGLAGTVVELDLGRDLGILGRGHGDLVPLGEAIVLEAVGALAAARADDLGVVVDREGLVLAVHGDRDGHLG